MADSIIQFNKSTSASYAINKLEMWDGICRTLGATPMPTSITLTIEDNRRDTDGLVSLLEVIAANPAVMSGSQISIHFNEVDVDRRLISRLLEPISTAKHLQISSMESSCCFWTVQTEIAREKRNPTYGTAGPAVADWGSDN